jgi:hypothetical protein
MTTPVWHPDPISVIGSTIMVIMVELPIFLAVWWPIRRLIRGAW